MLNEILNKYYVSFQVNIIFTFQDLKRKKVTDCILFLLILYFC